MVKAQDPGRASRKPRDRSFIPPARRQAWYGVMGPARKTTLVGAKHTHMEDTAGRSQWSNATRIAISTTTNIIFPVPLLSPATHASRWPRSTWSREACTLSYSAFLPIHPRSSWMAPPPRGECWCRSMAVRRLCSRSPERRKIALTRAVAAANRQDE